MSRQIDLSAKLSPEDRQYLLDRCRVAEVAENDERFPEDEAPEEPEPKAPKAPKA